MKRTKLFLTVLLLSGIMYMPKVMADFAVIESDSATLRTEVKQQAIEREGSWSQKRKTRRAAPASTFEASVGVGVITSKVYVGSTEYKSKAGLDWKLAYDYVFSNGIGFGVLYSGFSHSFPGADMKLSYLAPAFVGRIQVKNWMFKYDAGVGLFIYGDGHNHYNRIGFHVGAGAEYMLGKHVGIGLSLNDVIGSMPRYSGQNDNEWAGIVRINLLAGLRFYF